MKNQMMWITLFTSLAAVGCVSGGDSSGTWTATAHPCDGHRTDALFCDDADHCFVGCGTTTIGKGLYEDITPYDADGKSPFDDVSRCQAFPEGVIITGANGLFARNF